jgi:hypothetical protein
MDARQARLRPENLDSADPALSVKKYVSFPHQEIHPTEEIIVSEPSSTQSLFLLTPRPDDVPFMFGAGGRCVWAGYVAQLCWWALVPR